jgi:integrase
MPGRKKKASRRGTPWLRKLANGTLRWYLPKHLTGGKLVPVERADGSFVDGPENEVEARRLAAELEVARRAGAAGMDNPLRLVLDRYLLWLEEERKASADYQESALRFFREFLKLYTNLTVGELTVRHFTDWFAARPGWSDRYKTLAGRIFQSALNWARGVEGGRIIPQNPLEGWRLRTTRSRGAEVLVEPADHEAMLEAASPALRDVLVVLRETGTRPVNLCRATAANLDRDQRALVLAEHNVRGRAHKTADKTGRPLVVPLTDAAYEVCVRLAERHPEGPLFRTYRGRPWTDNVLAARVYYLSRKLGVKVTAYGYRHTRATELLANGTPDAVVAAVLGHTGTAMLYKHYGHLTARVDLLRAHLEALGGPRPASGTPPGRPDDPTSGDAGESSPPAGA